MNHHRRKILPIALTLFGLGNFGHNLTFAQGSKPAPAQAPAGPDYALRISTKDSIAISLKAENIRLPTIAGEISNKLKIPVILGPSASKRQVTTDFKSLTLEPALQLLAPVVFIDYEVNRYPGAPPLPVGIYLNDEDDTPPTLNAVVATNSQAMLIEGNTEDGVETSEAAQKEEPLRVTYERSALTVKAKQQPLAVVLYKVANEIGIPFEMKADKGEVVDLDINKASVEDAVVRMSPNVRLYVRADLRRLERRLLLMVLVAPRG